MEREEKYKSLMSAFETLKTKLEGETHQESELGKMIHEKEEELEKINFQNASYRAQLIELKISMSKARDASRFSEKDDANVVKLHNPKAQLEEAEEKIAYQQSKIKEQESIIETLLAQTQYYKNSQKDSPHK